MPIHFMPFDRDKPVRIYRRHLPHWRQDGATYFVTFRLHDALPQHCVQHLDQLRAALKYTKDMDDSWLEADRKYFAKMKHYLDAGYGACRLTRPKAGTCVGQALEYFENERYQLGEYAVMPNHVHVLVKPLPSFELEDIVHSWKSFTALQINRSLGREGILWQDESYDRLVRDSVEFTRTETYIRRNVF